MPTPLPAAAPSAAPNLHATRVDDVFYPCSDGEPMADNMAQATAMMGAAGDLGSVRPDALVAADILVYPERGNNRNRIAPDVLVGLGLGMHLRSSYFVWEEGKPPDWVLEVASPGTQAKDRSDKRQKYAAIGVPEYWLFDPTGEVYPHGTPRLQGLKLVAGKYQPLPWRLAHGERVIRSKILRLDVSTDGLLLRFRDAATGKVVRHRPEVDAAAERAEAQIRQEVAQRKAAESRAEREAARANREAAARSAAEARVAELEAALRRSQSGHPP